MYIYYAKLTTMCTENVKHLQLDYIRITQNGNADITITGGRGRETSMTALCFTCTSVRWTDLD